MGNNLNKFILLMWKNWTLLRRRPIHTAFEIIYPVLMCLVLVGVRSLIKVEREEVAYYQPLSSSDTILCKSELTLAYSPNESPLINRVIESLSAHCPDITYTGYKTADDMNKAFNYITYYSAIQFDDALKNVNNTNDLPSDLNVVLRFSSEDPQLSEKQEWFTNLIYPPFQSPGPRESISNDPQPKYGYRGFLYMQQLLTLSLINNGLHVKAPISLNVNRYPYPSWLDDQFYNTAFENMLSMMIMISFMYNYINTIRAITTEKEKQLKESMKIMGLPGWLHWLAWFLRTFIILLIAIILIVIVLKVNFKTNPVFSHSDGSLIFVFLLIFACSTIMFTFVISVFFSKANTAAAIGSLVFFLTYLPYSLQVQQYDSLSLSSILSSCLLANSGLSFGLTVILKFEAVEEGIQWNNVWDTVSPDDHLTFGAVILMLILDTFLYLIIALYIEAVFPGDFGVPQPWYFPVSRAYWCNKPGSLDHEPPSYNKGGYFEAFTENIPKGIELKNLSKSFGSNKAVKKLNLDMYQGHITVLLGHNGAGKTTTMSMITGMFPPTKGTAIVSGYDVRTSIGRVRDSMGLCLQHNVLFDNLTVREHLYFFGKLKGLQNNEIEKEINMYLQLLELEDKRNAASRTLSGGMKRKLSVAMALCGKSKVVMLDEPTAGMDPSARRTVWNLLQKQKEGRTILLTTHFMDEADLLGDRIAIMTAGGLQCCGSSFFLKRKYGAGYYLIMDVSPRCIPENVTSLLKKHIPKVEVYSHVGSELTYQLSESDSPKFESMLYELECNIDRLEVRSYGVSLTTLEEVFMKVGADQENKSYKTQKNGNHTEIMVDKTYNNSFGLLQGFPLIRNQFIAMVLKKFFSMLRTWQLFIVQVILPIALILITVLTTRAADYQRSTFPSLELSLKSYRNPITLISGNPNNDLYNQYINNKLPGTFEKVQDISSIILAKTKNSPAVVKSTYIVGAHFENYFATAWYNGELYHSAPLAFGLVLNALYKNSIGSNKSISFVNHPLPLSLKAQMNQTQFNIMGFQLSVALGYGMAFVASFYILFCIKERVSKSKHLQFVSGMNVFVFWGTSFLCDFINYLITMIAILITMAALQQDGFKTADEMGRLTLVLIYFGLSVLPFVYLLSFLFPIPSTGFSRIMLLGAVTGIIAVSVMQVLEIESLNLLYVAKPLNWILLFIPFYSICKAVYDLNALYTLHDLCSKTETLDKACYDIHYFAMTSPGIGRNVIIAFLMCIILFALIIFNEYGFFSYFKDKIINYNKPPVRNTALEEDVEEENTKIKSTSEVVLQQQYTLILRDMTKYYKKFLAVNGICLGVKPYECFGLLGVNGAGKTSTFKMMTGDEQISFGNAWVKGMSVRTQQKEVQKLIGYCPQFDALLDDLTVRETLNIFALIRGVPFERCTALGEELAHEFDFFKHIDKQVKQLSGGNKRKLSTALALIGDPPVIYLDEPTTGMDPATKRYLWTALGKLRDNGKCIILTSHSMEECEALCTRIAIMVNGSFQCLGSTQRLKNKFAQGFSLTIKLKKSGDHGHMDDDIIAVDHFIQTTFPGAQLKEKYQELLAYQLANNSMPWSQMFGILERSKQQLNIEDYSLGQCSLEQVFLSFTKYQL